MRSINADETIQRFKEWQGKCAEQGSYLAGAIHQVIQFCIETIDVQPTIETVKRGKWEIHLLESEGHIFGKSLLCSECGWFWREALHRKNFKYCPNCGAKMERESE